MNQKITDTGLRTFIEVATRILLFLGISMRGYGDARFSSILAKRIFPQ
ncbi:hypothetical protein C7S17_7363 [Burkholderia thailandensis]|nr:hypothetical protein [Burkholderia thailandensis]